MNPFTFTITRETAAELQREREELERQMANIREKHQLVVRKLEAIPLFLPEVSPTTNGHGEKTVGSGAGEKPTDEAQTQKQPPRDLPAEATLTPSVPMAIKQILQTHGRMTAVEIRNAILKTGVERERLGATFSYLYTALGRLVQKGQIQRLRGGKYQLPPGVTFQYRPDDDDMKL
jgi:hypothetical protein